MRTFATLATLTLLATSADASPAGAAQIQEAHVERTRDGAAVVRWTSTPADAPVDVFIGARRISDDDRDGRHALSAEDAARRPLIRLTASNGSGLVTAERVLPLQGGRNFRDLGGYRTADGKRVKWGRVFRSGTMVGLTDADYALLSSLGIRVVCDFRANDERESEPTLWKSRDSKLAYHTRDYTQSASSLAALFGEGTPTAEQVRASMTRLYGDLAYDHAESYRTMFKSLAAGEAPLAFNCSAGKDRTGVAAALLLTMLGVPRETILADYAMSEKVVNYEAQFAAQETKSSADAAPRKKTSWDFVAQLPPDVRAPLMRSDPEYLRAALQSIEQREGSIEAYFERVLSITKTEQKRIRELLLES